MKIHKQDFFWIPLLLLAAVFFVISSLRTLGTNQGYEPTQPVKFSHLIHVGTNKIQCLYCHFAAEKGRSAGMPPTELCMNCHNRILIDSPEIKKIADALATGEGIKWNKVHSLPDHVYFNHSQHVVVAKLTCQTCHGPVETMSRIRQDQPMLMGWCLDCHRQKGIAMPNATVTSAGSNCAACHY